MRNAWILFGLSVLFWGINWPIMKVGLNHISPLWFATLRVWLAAAALFAFLGIRGNINRPEKSEWPVLFSVGFIQIGLCMALLHTALLYVDAGRTAVLAYTIPIWAAPMAILFLGERLTSAKIAGILLGMSGVITLFGPETIFLEGKSSAHPFAPLLPLGSALLWAGVIVHIRSHGWTRPHMSLLPWQLLIGAGVLSALALAVEGLPKVTLNVEFILILAFNAIVATAFSFWAYIGAARVLPANVTALASLAVPVVGVISSTLALGEPLTASILVGMTLIGLGMILSTVTVRH